jgi:hypothetical protein
MRHPTPAERTLYGELTRMLIGNRHRPQAEVEAGIEKLLRDYVRRNPELGVGGLQITLTWRLPEGADDWAVYGTEYQTLRAEDQTAEPMRAVAGGSAEVVAFHAVSSSPREALAGGVVGQVIPFTPRAS